MDADTRLPGTQPQGGEPRRGLPFFPRFTAGVLRLVAACVTRVRVEGLERIPASGPVLFASNHSSNADGMLFVAFVVPAVGRPIGWLGKEEATRWPFFGWAMRQNGVIGIRRGASDLEAFKTAKSILDGGGVLTIFPEGTRSPDGRLQEAKEGATVLAVRSGAPIVPVGIAGSHRFWRKGSLVPRPGGRITVRVGEPFRLTLPRGGNRRDAMRDATTELMRHIAELLPPEQRGVYADAVVPSEQGHS